MAKNLVGTNLDDSLPRTKPFLWLLLHPPPPQRGDVDGGGGGIDGFVDLLWSLLFNGIKLCPEEEDESSSVPTAEIETETDRISALEARDRFRCPHCNNPSPLPSPPPRLGFGIDSWEWSCCCVVDLNRNPLGIPSIVELLMLVPPPLILPSPVEIAAVVLTFSLDLEGEGLK